MCSSGDYSKMGWFLQSLEKNEKICCYVKHAISALLVRGGAEVAIMSKTIRKSPCTSNNHESPSFKKHES